MTLNELERKERKVVKKNTKVKDPEALKRLLFGDKSIDINDCIETKVIVKISKKERLKRATGEYEAQGNFKKCTCCGDIKTLDNFYKHDITNDGYRYFCIKCYKDDVAERYHKNKGDEYEISK